MGRDANANAAPSSDAMRRMRFENVRRVYPPHRVGNEEEAYRVFCVAGGGRRLSTVVEAIMNLTLEHGAEVPFLAEALSNLECAP